MATYAMPSEVQVDAMGDHARYLLPRRRLGGVHWLGLFPIAFGLFALWILSNMFGGIRGFWSGDGAGRIFAIGFAVFLLVFVVPILRLMLFGLVMMIGRTEIRFINGRLSAREHAGPLFMTRRFKKKTPIGRVSVGYGDGTVTVNGQPSDKFKALASTAALGVEAGPEKKDRFLLTIGYPKEMLLPIGQDLAERMHVEFREGLLKAGEWFGEQDEGASA